MSSTEKSKSWKSGIDQLAGRYAEVERRTFSLPEFSLAPLGIFLWAMFKAALLLELDALTIIPVNLAIAARNIFPGRWSYRSFSARYLRAAIRWIRNGEIPLAASFVVRGLVSSLLGWHFNRRLLEIRRRMILDNELDANDRTLLTSEIDRLILQWPAPRLLQGLFTYGLPLLSPLAALYQMMVPSAPSIWTRVIVIFSLSYALGLVASSFVVKRGLMLGGEGRGAYFPGFLEGNGVYEIEQQLFASFGLVSREFPLAYAIVLLLVPLQLFQSIYMYDTGLYAKMLALPGPEAQPSKAVYLIETMAAVFITVLLGAVALGRRNKLKRY